MEANEPYQVEFSEEAIEDLEQIKVFLTRLFSSTVAEQSISEVFERCLALSRFPQRGKRDDHIRSDAGHLRYMMVKKSRIQYLIEGNIVYILRIQDARQHPFTF